MNKLETLTEEKKKQLLTKLLSQKNDNIQSTSLGQTRLWLLNELNSNSSVYNINTAIHIEGELDEIVLQAAIVELVKRHASLRTSLPKIKSEPYQVISAKHEKASKINYIDYSTEIIVNSKECMDILINSVNEPFNLHEGPLFRTKLFKFKKNNFVLVFTMHHGISDGWSTGILIRDFIELYNKKFKNLDASLKKLEYKYTDFSRWQHKTVQSNEYIKKMNFWKEKLSGELPVLQLPIDYLRGNKQTYKGEQVGFLLKNVIFEKIKNYCLENNITVFMFLLGAYKSMIYKLTNQNDIIIGIPVANREKKEFEDIIGYFGNTIALRTNIHGEMSFSDILNSIKDGSLEAFEYQEVPFEKVVEVVNPVRSDNYPPIFQAMFVLQNDPIRFSELMNLNYDILNIHTNTSKYDITFKMAEQDGYLTGQVEYNSDLFKAEKIQLFIELYNKIIHQILQDSSQLLKDFTILNSNQIEIIQKNQQDYKEIPKSKSVQDVFLEVVQLYNEKVAIQSPEKTLTYQQLEDQSNKLTNYLIEKGAEVGQKIGVLLKRSSNSIEAILAVLKAGCCYVPIDPDYPIDRIHGIIEDSNIDIIITDETNYVSNLKGKLIVNMEKDAHRIANSQIKRPRLQVNGDAPAYIMYTSGSTGTPKGVEISHKSIIRLVKNTNYHDFQSHETFLLFSTLSFDASTFEIYGSLLNGSKLVIYPIGLPTLDDLTLFIKKQKVSTMFLTVGLFQQLNDEHILNINGLKKLLVGGDTMPIIVAKKFKELAPNTILTNVYGPTENTTFSTFYEVSKSEDWSKPIPIGRAISNTTLYIFDNDLNLLPNQVPGELYLGGVGLSKGYLKRDELTREKFIKNPLNLHEDPFLYKTGDRVQRLKNGDIEFLGRIDNQVKVRGFRIELGEIEHVLSRHKDVKEVIVTLKSSVNSHKQLIAYIVSEVSNEIIRKYLAEFLPDYMIPSHIINIERFPLKASGKIDIEKLPEPLLELEKQNFDINCYSDVQLAFSEIWSEYLGVNKSNIGLDNDFFELGGDSILAIQIISKINKRGYKLSPKHLLENRTIRKLVNISQHFIGNKITPIDSIKGEITLTPIQNWFFNQDIPDKNHFNMSQLYELNGNKKSIEIALQKVINNHDAFKIRFNKTDNEYIQYYNTQTQNYNFESVDISKEKEVIQERILKQKAFEMQKSIDICKGPIINCMYFTRNENENDWLFITVHHLVMDGISWRIFTEDFRTEYQNLIEGNTTTISKTSSFKKWSENLKTYARTDQLKRETKYWLTTLTDKPSSLPTDFNKGNNRAATSMITKKMSVAATKLLLSDVQKTYNTQINDILLTSLVDILRNWTGNTDVLINLEGHGRENGFENTDISRTIGWFTTIFPVEFSTEWFFNKDLGAAIKSVKEQIRKIPKKGLSYGIARYLSEDKVTRDLLISKKNAEISFNYMGQFSNGSKVSAIVPSNYHVDTDRTNQGLREHLIEINCSIQENILVLNWTFSKSKYKFDTIDKLASQYILVLEKFINHCMNKNKSESTPSDFPLATLNQSELDYIEESYDGQIEDIWNPTPLQEGMLFHTLYDDKRSMYYVQSCSELHGKIDFSIFNKSWNILIDRHDILRSQFILEKIDKPLLLVNKKIHFNIEVFDRSIYSKQQNDKFFEELVEIDRHESINLTIAPLMKIKLIKYSDHLTKMIWGYHHAIMDGWTYTLIMNDLFSIYRDLKTNNFQEFLDKHSFANYITWRKEKKAQEVERSFWSKELKGIQEATSLNINDKKDKNTGSTNNTLSLLLSKKETKILDLAAKRNKVTLNTLCLGSWALLLSKYSSSKDVIFGVTGSGRSTEIIDSEDTVGLFINTLPMRIILENDTEISVWLKDIQNKQWQLREYEYSSLSDIKEWSEMDNSSPLFNQIFVFENYPSIDRNPNQKNDFVMKNQHSIEHTNYPLSVTVKPGEQIELEISYIENEYTSISIRRMLEHFKNIALELANTRITTVNHVNMLGIEEEYKIINEFNHEIEFPESRDNIISIFKNAAEKNPSQIAIISGNKKINYEELDKKSDMLALSLLQKGIKRNEFIGLSMNKSIELFIGLLGILKAGAAYVPIDPEYPEQRISHLIKDSAIDLILSDEKSLGQLNNYLCEVLTINELESAEKIKNLIDFPKVLSNDICYVNYTSGSTGKPKGVMVTHGNLVNINNSWRNDYNLLETNAHLQMASLSFDVFTGDWVRALCSGKKLVLCERDQLLDPMKLYKLMVNEKVDVGEFVPVVLRSLINYLNNINKSLDFMKLVICGSDSWYTSEYNYFLKFCGPNTRLVNSFGLTEVTIDSSYFERKELFNSSEEKLVPIGKPFKNQQFLILDKNQKLQPINVPGELYIGGAGVSKGYVNNEELTKKSFLINPWDKSRNSNMYKTGDLARFLEDGNVELLGRTDSQVKVRGFRIEIGEIELTLKKHPLINKALVLTHTETTDNKVIVAYVVTTQTLSRDDYKDIKEFLSGYLPWYMIPSFIKEIETIPITPNGKIDKLALPTLKDIKSNMYQASTSPTTENEIRLRDIWEVVLGIKSPSIEENFYDLGGNSLLATQLALKIKKVFNTDISVKDVLKNPTIQGFAKTLR